MQSRGECTEEHTDYYRFEHLAETSSEGEGSDNDIAEDGARDMFTCWIPLGCLPISHGTLAVAEGSHLLNGYARGVYSSERKEELPPDFARWQQGPPPGVWRTAAFLPGDVVLFDIRLVHASTRNDHPFYRLSLDTRWKATAHVGYKQRDAFTPLEVPEE